MTPGTTKIAKSRVLSAARLSGLAAVLGRLFALLSTIVVARQLGPQAVGVLAIVFLVTELLGLFAEAGISSAIVQAREISLQQRATLYAMELLLGLAAALVMLAIAPLIASAAGIPDLVLLISVASLSILIESTGRHISAMLQRELDFGPVYMADLARDFTRAFGSIGLVISGYGIWSVVIAHIAGSVALSALLSLCGLRRRLFPGLTLALGKSRSLLAFGIYRAATVGLNRIGQRADQMVVAAFLPTEVLGLYRMATQLAASPLIALQSISARISFSIFSRQQTEPKVALRSFLILVATQSFVALPLSLFLATAGERISVLILGSSWEGTGILITILIVFYLVRMQEGSALPLVNGLGKPKWALGWSLFASTSYILVTLIAAQAGSAIIVALTMAALQIALIIIFYALVLRPLVGDFTKDYFSAIAPACASGLLATLSASGLFVSEVIPDTPLGLLAFLAIQMSIYVVLSLKWNREPFEMMLDALWPGPPRTNQSSKGDSM